MDDTTKWHKRLVNANEKSALLSVKVDDWKGSGFTSQFRPSPDRKKISITGQYKIEPDYISAEILFGELTHALRSVLDNIAYSVSDKSGLSENQIQNISYPVFTDRSKFVEGVKKCLPGVDDDILKLIESSQPFNNREGYAADPLYLLHRANIWDKHRLPIACALVKQELDVEYEEKSKLNNFPSEIHEIVSEEPMMQGGEIAKIIFTNPYEKGLKIKVNVRMQFSLLIDGKYYSIKHICDSFLQKVTLEIVNPVSAKIQTRK